MIVVLVTQMSCIHLDEMALECVTHKNPHLSIQLQVVDSIKGFLNISTDPATFIQVFISDNSFWRPSAFH
jgi:hypothetical protein